MTDLLTFLRQRLDDDAECATRATAGPWHVIHDDDHHAMSLVAVSSEPQRGRSSDPDEYVAATLLQTAQPRVAHTRQRWHENAAHIARHHPDHVLAEIDAKRGILDRVVYSGDIDSDPLAPVLRLLALPYASHPDYREEWLPEGASR